MCDKSLGGGQFTQTPIRNSTKVPTGHVICSENWRASELTNSLKGAVNINYEDKLGVVDFHPSSDVAVVYLSEGDLVTGTSYKRKLAKLRMGTKMRGIVLAERTPTSCQYFSALQKFTVLELGLVLIPVTSQQEAANILIQLVGLENRPHTNQFRMKRKPQPVDGSILTTLQLVPRLGDVKARALLDKFHSIEQICNASIDDLASVVGKVTAVQVKTFFDSKPS